MCDCDCAPSHPAAVPDPAAGTSSGDANRSYWVTLPPGALELDVEPAMLVLMLHGWFDMAYDPAARDAAEDELLHDNITAYVAAADLNVITVFPVGSGAGETGNGSAIYAWNAPGNGVNTAPGPKGPTCATPRPSADQCVVHRMSIACAILDRSTGGGGREAFVIVAPWAAAPPWPPSH